MHQSIEKQNSNVDYDSEEKQRDLTLQHLPLMQHQTTTEAGPEKQRTVAGQRAEKCKVTHAASSLLCFFKFRTKAAVWRGSAEVFPGPVV